MGSSTKQSVLWSSLSGLFLILAVPGCDTSMQSAAQGPEAIGTAKERLISDETHHHGSLGFHFLPPMVSPPASYGDFVPGLPVTVRVDELTPTGKVLRTLATFTQDSGPRGEHLRVHIQDQPCDDSDGDDDARGYYFARWRTDDANLTPMARYRVRVLVPARGGQSRELGFADVDVATTTRDFRRVDVQEFTPLINGTTLRIKFRVDTPAVDKDGDGVFDWQDNCPDVANPDQLDSMSDGTGDTCRCAKVVCPHHDSCHQDGQCQPTTGTCTVPVLPNGTRCRMAHADASCTEGVCLIESCHSHFADCNGDPSDGCETAIATKDNCGGCGVVCPQSPDGRVFCRNEQCQMHCRRGTGNCDGDVATGCETDLDNDPHNCGTCGNTCENKEGCIHGGCTTRACQEGWANCDRNHENGCETNIFADANSCGSCQHQCSNLPNAVVTCSGGSCVIGSCSNGFVDCNGIAEDGCETNINEDLNNCGACGSVCAPNNARVACEVGICGIAACDDGRADCDGLVDNGCESVLASDTQNCGACGKVCSAANATAQCTAGICGIGPCNSGFADCDGLLQDGCETVLNTDAANCGACGTTCPGAPNATPICSDGSCSTACNSGFADCDQDPSNGCEQNLAGNCGVCGNTCTLPHASGECVNGVCSFSVCDEGYADCDGKPANGCEVNLRTSAGNCGQCGSNCWIANTNTACVDGACAMSSCVPGYGDCNGQASDGCEHAVNSDKENCGACGHACPAPPPGFADMACNGGICVPSCDTAHTMLDCDGDQTCENLKTDNNNCGACGKTCPTYFSWACDQGECGGPCPNGTHCGFGVCCPYTYGFCNAGPCVPFSIHNCEGMNKECFPGVADNLKACVQGKCVDLRADPANCGALGNVCPEATTCFSGQCICDGPGPGCLSPW